MVEHTLLVVRSMDFWHDIRCGLTDYVGLELEDARSHNLGFVAILHSILQRQLELITPYSRTPVSQQYSRIAIPSA